MAGSAGKSIVTDGLVLHYDFANYRSTTGIGTIVNDLSGNEKHCTLYNSPVYTAANGGGFTFDRVNDYGQTNNAYTATTLPIGAASRTIISCFKTTTASNINYDHILHYGSMSANGAFGIALQNFGGGVYRIANHTWAGSSYFTNFPVYNYSPYFVALTYNNARSPRNLFFVNGTWGTTGYAQGKSQDYALDTGNGVQCRIGVNIQGVEYFGGNIYLAQIFNRVLTDSEITQIYESVRGRFGL